MAPDLKAPDQMTTWLDAEELKHASPLVECGPCQDFRTNVTDGREHPCPACRPENFKVWRLHREATTLILVARSVSHLVRVVAPYGSPEFTVKPVDPATNDGDACVSAVKVESIAGGDAWWAELRDLEIVEG